MDEVDRIDVSEGECEDLEGEDPLYNWTELHERLQTKREDDAVELWHVVLWITDGSCEHDGKPGRTVWMNAVFVGRVIDTSPLCCHVDAEASEGGQDASCNQWIVEQWPCVQPLSVLEVDFEVREQDTKVEVCAP